MLRATLKSLLSRKLRLVLAGTAVILGVMFVSGAFVLTDTLSRSFDSMFSGAFAGVDVQVSTARPAGARSDDPTPPLPASLLDTVAAVPGVAGVTGVVREDGARVIGHDGKVVSTFGPPRLGVNWTDNNQRVLREGHPPTADDQVAINAGLATAAGVHLGDHIGVLT